MRKSTKIVIGFASVGFVLPWGFLAFYAIAHRFDLYPSTTPLFYLCPSSIMSLGLDNASLLVGLTGWLFISASNALLYGGPILAVVVVYRVIRPGPQPHGRWLQ
jgi:hypothetical protein